MRSMVAALLLALLLASCTKKKKVDPHRFQIVTETAVVRAGDTLPASSPIFDGKRIRLRGVRGETMSFSVVFSGDSSKSSSSEKTSDAVSLEGFGEGLEVTRFRIVNVPVVEGSSAMFGPSRGAGLYPDRLVRDETGSGAVLFDVSIGDVAANVYRAQLRLGNVSIPVELDVRPFSIELSRAPLVWAWYRAEDIGDVALQKKYQALFLRHGVLLATDPSADELEAHRELINPSALYWPVRVRSDDPETLAANTRAVIAFFESLAPTPFTIPIDEPSSDDVRKRVVENGRIIREAGGGPQRLLHTVTDYQRPIYGDSVDIYISPNNVTSEKPAPEKRWTYNGRPPQAGNMTIDSKGGSLRSWGWIAARYNVELWYAWHGLYWTDRYNKAAEPTDFSKNAISFDQRRKADGSRRSADYGNGDGVLVYPGLEPSLRLKALRRGLQDRLLLAKLAACGGAAEAEQIARVTVPRALGEATRLSLWPSDESGWEQARSAVLDAIEARCPPE